MHMHKPGWVVLSIMMVCAATLCRAADIQMTLSSHVEGQRHEATHNRKLYTALSIAKDQQDKWRGVMNALMGAIVGAFTKDSLDAAGELVDSLLHGLHPASGGSTSPDSQEAAGSQQPQQPVAQVIQMPPAGQQSGLTITTSTPVDVEAPVTVDTPVKQTNVQG